jgi:hypothetical protein
VAQTTARILVPGQAHVFLGPVGTAAPINPVVALNVAMIEVGFFTEDSLKFSTSPNIESVTSHQSAYPTRRMETATEATVECDLQEWSSANFASVYGGGTTTEITPATVPPSYKFSPPAIGSRAEVMAIVKIIDGAKTYLLIVPRAMQTEGVAHELNRTAESVLPLRLSVLGSSVGDPYYWMTTDPSWAAA